MGDVFDLELVHSTLRLSTPLILAALGGVLSERSGVINIALEGMMLCGAFFGMLGSYLTGNPWAGLALGTVSGAILGFTHALLTQRARLNHIVSGIALNILALGLTTFLLRRIFQHAGGSPPVKGIPNLWEQSPLFYLVIVLTCSMWFMMYRTPIGLRIRASGENPEAAKTVGINVRNVRYLTVTSSGILAGLSGVYLSLCQLNMFSEGMSGGRGFIALAAVVFGKWNPFGTAAAALFFGFFDALQMRLQGKSIGGITIPSEFMLMLPYVLTIVALAGVVGRATAPAALGQEDE